jgi:hypothetical protein
MLSEQRLLEAWTELHTSASYAIRYVVLSYVIRYVVLSYAIRYVYYPTPSGQ